MNWGVGFFPHLTMPLTTRSLAMRLRCTRMAARRQRRCLQQICRRRADLGGYGGGLGAVTWNPSHQHPQPT